MADRTSEGSVVKQPLPVLPEGHPATFYMTPGTYITVKRDGSYVVPEGYVSANAGTSSLGSNFGGTTSQNQPSATDPAVLGGDTPSLTDIENITFVEYYDEVTKFVKIKAIVRIRNNSRKAADVEAIDARIYDPSDIPTVVAQTTFVTPTPSTPSVIFDRYGSSNTALAWGWNNSTGLGSYSSVTYEWAIYSAKTGGTIIDSGTKTYTNTGSHPIGNLGKSRVYRVSSSEGDTAATASARWLQVRTVVIGTDDKKYMSQYSTRI